MRSLNLLKTCSLIGASAVVLGQTGLSGQPLPERPGASRPVQLSKPRVEPLPETQWNDEHKKRAAQFLPAAARPGNSFLTLLNVPELVDHTMSFYRYVSQDSSLPPRIRELLMLRTAWLHGSDVIWRER
ncbi:MAG TPA: hypothetical protein VFV49_15570, partial [Thermoanaerobaculia bacterium]|nr:hypothetical protein [Thermoanaerobaculia bacterium]